MTYTYKASRKDGTLVSGFIEAQNSSEAAGFLRNKSLTPITIQKEKKSNSFGSLLLFKKQNTSDLVVFTRQLASMLTSGLTLMQAMNILKDQLQKDIMRDLVNDVISEIEEGKSFATAIAKHPKVFSPIYIALIRAGEKSGLLDKVLIHLADNLEKQEQLQSTVKSAILYPVIIVIMMIAVMIVMMVFVIPPLSNLYDSLQVSLPLATQVVIGLSKFIIGYWWFVVLSSVSLWILFKKWHATQTGILIMDKIVLDIPVIGSLIQKAIIAEFTRTLGLLISSGTLVVDSLIQSADVANNKIYKSAILEISHRVEKGITIGDAMSVYTLFPPIVIQMVRIGEQTGKLDESLLRVSEYFEREVEASVKNLTTALEPIIMVILGVGVAFLVFSIIVPIYNLTNSIH